MAKKVKDLADTQSRYEIIKEGFKEVKSLAFQEVLEELNSKTNSYLAELMAGSTSIKFSNMSQDGDVSKITTTLIIDGVERQLGLFSGGQTRRIMLAVDLAISDIIHTRKGITNKLLILDEYFKDLSEESISRVCGLLSSIKADVIMIEHNSMLNSLANNVFEIEYKNGISSVKN
jgi:DNA repair exonuclease SbcCD ATPase subunit